MAVEVTNAQPDWGEDETKGYALYANQKLLEKVSAATKEIGDLANEAPTNNDKVDEWKQRLRDLNEKHKKEINTIVDKAFDDALAAVYELPDHEQNHAANQWTSASDLLMESVQRTVEFSKKACEAVAKASNVSGAMEIVKGWADEASDAIKEIPKKIEDVYNT